MKEAFLRGLVKAAYDKGVHPLDIVKLIKFAHAYTEPAITREQHDKKSSTLHKTGYTVSKP